MTNILCCHTGAVNKPKNMINIVMERLHLSNTAKQNTNTAKQNTTFRTKTCEV